MLFPSSPRNLSNPILFLPSSAARPSLQTGLSTPAAVPSRQDTRLAPSFYCHPSPLSSKRTRTSKTHLLPLHPRATPRKEGRPFRVVLLPECEVASDQTPGIIPGRPKKDIRMGASREERRKRLCSMSMCFRPGSGIASSLHIAEPETAGLSKDRCVWFCRFVVLQSKLPEALFKLGEFSACKHRPRAGRQTWLRWNKLNSV